ncbi:related to DNA-directed RNA polymerase II regulator [Melanopsichium pennsylvanicum]|uniref:Related to DNA-directed RNA polymerase II regulator n=2 Tax=Melanopsichium pennsylvanicum TaxID=63383 RepID=A0AAJ4XRH0_9BASI|nr:related to DNA-directed RNA polymerase II regulator [Melanopsichium pennsylvanicum 4]SNX87022.1 related to DNA-directed RNA polymerase II regulator [Melanopsichium pennsylvanicum]
MSYSNGANFGPGPSSSASTSRSKRELIDRVRYPNPIPLPPYPPKLVNIPTEPSRYANPHFADRLASQQPIPMIVDVHAGMPIDLANFQNLWEGDLSEVVVPASATLDAQDIDDADAFLLQDFATNLPPATASNSAPGAIGLISSLKAIDDPASQATLQAAIQQRHTQSLGPGAKAALAADDVTWLRRTEYLSSQQKSAQQQVQKPKLTERIDVSRQAQLAKIQNSFVDAQKPLSSLVHPHKKGVKALQVFDFLPDPETWATNYQVVRFIDHPGRIINGVPQNDPRLDVALFRPVEAADGEQRVSYYLPAGEEISEDAETSMALLDNREVEENNARRLRKRRRTGKFPIPPESQGADNKNDPDRNLLKKDYATAFKLSRDYVPKDTTETAHDVLLLTLDDGIPDADPDADVDPIKGVKFASSKPINGDDEDDDLFGDDEDVDDNNGDHTANQVDSTIPPQSEHERQKRSRRSAATKGKERSEQPAGQGLTSEVRPKAYAYYHKVGMRFTLRVWRSRFANNEKLRNRDRRYPGKWDAIVLSNRELEEKEKLRRLHARSHVDDVGELEELSEDELEQIMLEEEAAVNGADHSQDGQEAPPAETNSANADGGVDDADAARESEDDEGAREQGNGDDDDDDNSNSDDEDDDDATVDGDEELAALRAEAGEVGEDLDVEGGRRSRSRRSAAAPAQASDATPAMEEDDED